MPAPNLLTPTAITGKSDFRLVTDSLAAITTNAAASGLCLKVDSLVATNVTAGPVTVTVVVTRSGTDYPLAVAAPLAAYTAAVFVSRDTVLRLEEGDAIRLQSNTLDAVFACCSYDKVS